MAVDIVIVDDEEMIQWTLKEAMEAGGYNVRTFGNGKDFLTDFKEHGADIVFLDVRLPDSNCLDGCIHNYKRKKLGNYNQFQSL